MGGGRYECMERHEGMEVRRHEGMEECGYGGMRVVWRHEGMEVN